MRDSEFEFLQAQRDALADASPNLVWAAHPNGERIYFNNRWMELTGRSLSQELGRGWLDSVHPDERQCLSETFLAASKAVKGYSFGYRLKAHDGTFCWVRESARPQVSATGELLGYIGLCIEEDSLRKGPRTVRRKISEIGTTNKNSPIGIWKLDSNLIVTSANKAAAKQLGMVQSDVVGKKFSQFVPAFNGKALIDDFQKGRHFSLHNHEVSSKTTNGEMRFLDLEAWPLLADDQTVAGFAVSTVEVTQRKLVEQQKSEFVATLVHDLKTPLIGADRSLKILLENRPGAMDDECAKVLELLKNSNYHLLSMVQNLIEVYRYEDEQPKLFFEAVAVDQIIQRVIADLMPLAEERKLTLTSDFPKNLKPIIGDSMAIRRVFQNLIDNAIKFCNRGGTVQVFVEEDDVSTTFKVRNSGAGVPAIEQANFFRKFTQGVNGRSTLTGSGLGLYLCKQIVEAHEGRITFASSHQDGTTLSVTLPKLVAV